MWHVDAEQRIARPLIWRAGHAMRPQILPMMLLDTNQSYRTVRGHQHGTSHWR